jgi:hypothetical protein
VSGAASAAASASHNHATQSSPPTSAATTVPDASVVAPVIDRKNTQRPEHTALVLEQNGRALFDAIRKDDPTQASEFFFPREPFTSLKDIPDPDRYWKQLFRAYEQDVHKLHRQRKDWSNTSFESLEPGTVPAWVPPGDEVNKIGYYRSWGTKLRYRVDGQLYTIKIHTVISWQGQWHITHLLPWKK